MEDWRRQRGYLGNAGKVADPSESISPLRTGKDVMHTLNEECVPVKNTGFSIDTIKQCTDHPRVIPNARVGATRDTTTDSAQIIGGMSDLKDLMQKRAWTDIRRGVFSPEPLDDMGEHWVEVTERSEMMCEKCKNFRQADTRRDTNTQNRTACLNCASNWTPLGMYEPHAVNMDEHAQDARVAARLLNVYNVQ